MKVSPCLENDKYSSNNVLRGVNLLLQYVQCRTQDKIPIQMNLFFGKLEVKWPWCNLPLILSMFVEWRFLSKSPIFMEIIYPCFYCGFLHDFIRPIFIAIFFPRWGCSSLKFGDLNLTCFYIHSLSIGQYFLFVVF